MPQYRFKDKVAVITGGARNQGLSHARLLASHGGHVVIADVSDDAGSEAAEQLRSDGLSVRFHHLDVSDPGDWRSLMDSVRDTEGRLDALVNNAAILGKADFETCSLEEWNTVLAVNLTGTFLGIQHAVPLMRQGGGGSIINISSVIGNLGTTFNAAYSVSKAAVQMITRVAAINFAPEIRVNTIVPGGIDTDMLRALPDDIRIARLATYPLQRAGTVEEVSHAVLYLASDESGFTTGSEVRVDGGALAGVARAKS